MAHDAGWSEPIECSDFINSVTHRQQLPFAISVLSQYIDTNNLHQTPFNHVETDIQYNDPKIKQFVRKLIPNKIAAKALFIDICALIEAAPITNTQLNMVSIHFTILTFDKFSMKHRRKCMKNIVGTNFEDGIYGLYTDLLDYNIITKENSSVVIDYLWESEICIDFECAEQWLQFLKKCVCEYAYHSPMDAIIFIKSLKLEWNRHSIDEYDEQLEILETYLLSHCGGNDEDKEEEPNANLMTSINKFENTFEWLKNDIYNAVGNDSVIESKQDMNNVQISQIKQIITDEEFLEELFFYSNEICPIQNSDFRRVFIQFRDNLEIQFMVENRIKCAKYIVTKYVNPSQARNDKIALKNDLISLNMNDNVLKMIFDKDLKMNNESSGAEAKENDASKLFPQTTQCEQFIIALFPIETPLCGGCSQHHKPSKTRECVQKWTKKDCEALLEQCTQIKGIRPDEKWFRNSVTFHSKVHPNRAFNMSAIDIRCIISEKIRNPQSGIDKHALCKIFDKYLKRHHREIKLENFLFEHGLSDFVTNRYIPYIPIIYALLNIKLNGDCRMTQRAMTEISFRISDIMIAFREKDPDRIVHFDLNVLYTQMGWEQMKHKLKERNNKIVFKFKVKTNRFYPSLFEEITNKIKLFKTIDCKQCVIKIFILLGKALKIRVEFATLPALFGNHKSRIEKKINHKNDPIYLPHLLYAWQRYQEWFANGIKRKSSSSLLQKCRNIMKRESKDNSDDSEDSTDCNQCNGSVDRIGHFQYSLIVFPQTLADESRVYVTKQLLCIGNGILPFQRKDIIQWMPMMFAQNRDRLSLEFVGSMEREYGNANGLHRNDFFYDRKYDEMKRNFDSVIADGFVGKRFYQNDDKGGDPNGVYKNDVNAICSQYRAVYHPCAASMDYDEHRLNILMEKDSDKIINVTWG